jgi:hypothetical protein
MIKYKFNKIRKIPWSKILKMPDSFNFADCGNWKWEVGCLKEMKNYHG